MRRGVCGEHTREKEGVKIGLNIMGLELQVCMFRVKFHNLVRIRVF
jgi:hypothetical protein